MITTLFTASARGNYGNQLFIALKGVMVSLMFLLSSSLAFGQMKEWDKTYGGAENDNLEIVLQTSDGGYIMGGTSASGISGHKSKASRGGSDFWVVKTDVRGQIEWNKVYGGDNSDRLSALIQTSDGGYLLGGTTTSGKNGTKSDNLRGEEDYWVVKINAKGKVQWDQSVGGRASDYLRDVIQTSDGGYLLGGESNSTHNGDKSEDSRGSFDYWIVKLNSKGKQKWDKTLGGNSVDYLGSVLETSDGGFLLGGSSVSYVSGDKTAPQTVYCDEECGFDFWLVKVDASGNMQWDRSIGAAGGEQGEMLMDMEHTMDGGYLLGGFSDSGASYDKSEPHIGTGWRDYWVVKVNDQGVIQWDKTIGGEADEGLVDVLATSDGGFLLGGYSQSGIGGDKTEPAKDEDINTYDYWVVKINSTGAKVWDRTFGGAGNSFLSSLALSKDGGYLLGGSTEILWGEDRSEESMGGFDYWVVKMQGDMCMTPTPSIALKPSSNTYTGGVMTNMYLGFGPKSMTLTASGGMTYSWSPVMGLSSTNTAETVFTPTEAGVYTFTVTAMNGECMATESVTITVMDIRCGSKLTKVLICHDGQMVCMEDDKAKDHLRDHPEDRLGECATDVIVSAKAEDANVQVYPNPFTGSTAISVKFTQAQEYTVEVYDGSGRKVHSWSAAKARAGEQVRLNWAPKSGNRGLYVVKIISKDGVQTRQILRQ